MKPVRIALCWQRAVRDMSWLHDLALRATRVTLIVRWQSLKRQFVDSYSTVLVGFLFDGTFENFYGVMGALSF
ncbi:hypothetical protein LAUMK191_04931 [Mycobacterium attenuatum]|uniref:Uncharacterized protein n=2 Tax=Mycobacterium attenuatum TaxID=2341086 RepID=A0A498QCV2_9MYCO|nr:hypothetical protein LAUMK136_04946 [Mycobacterium attenuatum]VBA59273.1 hypothetical protein LAUMK191_04931 [Mycobacterium attenuatum]VBA61717.1 hypothetical protein LAUMK41_05099 [Mycobacterium attenuatum]